LQPLAQVPNKSNQRLAFQSKYNFFWVATQLSRFIADINTYSDTVHFSYCIAKLLLSKQHIVTLIAQAVTFISFLFEKNVFVYSCREFLQMSKPMSMMS